MFVRGDPGVTLIMTYLLKDIYIYLGGGDGKDGRKVAFRQMNDL